MLFVFIAYVTFVSKNQQRCLCVLSFTFWQSRTVESGGHILDTS